MQEALECFHMYHVAFETAGVRPNGFSLPRQHALVHYITGIHLFGLPNGVCSSITESKHIHAVKKPWRASSKNNPLPQILQANQRLDKLSAARSIFTSRHMLVGDVLADALGLEPQFSPEEIIGAVDEAEDEVDGVDGEAEGVVELPQRQGESTLLFSTQLSALHILHSVHARCGGSRYRVQAARPLRARAPFPLRSGTRVRSRSRPR